MSCPEMDWKGYALNEITAPERRRMEEHLATCAACREELDGTQLTLATLKRLEPRVLPRPIRFVSDPVFEPSWWQRLWSSGARLGFASAAMLALALVAHGYLLKPAPAASGMSEAQVAARVEAEIEKRLPAAVEARVTAQLQPAVEGVKTELAAYKKATEEQRKADLRDVETAINFFQKKMNSMVLASSRYGGD